MLLEKLSWPHISSVILIRLVVTRVLRNISSFICKILLEDPLTWPHISSMVLKRLVDKLLSSGSSFFYF